MGCRSVGYQDNDVKMPYSYPYGTSSYYYDYPAGYYRASAAGPLDFLGNLDTTKLLKTGVLAAAMWLLFPKEKGMGKVLKVGAISAGTYLFY